jgi:hypothetical protein
MTQKQDDLQKQQYVKANQLNPVNDISTENLKAKMMLTFNNSVSGDRLQIHIGKIMITQIVAKIVYGDDPGFQQAGVSIGLSMVSDLVRNVLTVSEKLSKFGLDLEQAEKLSSIATSVMVKSLYERRMPNMKDIVLITSPEVVDMLVSGNERLEEFVDSKISF